MRITESVFATRPPRRRGVTLAPVVAIVAAIAAPGGALAQQPQPLRNTTAATATRVEVHEATVSELQEAMAAGRTTSAALVDAYLARIAAYDQRGPALNALIRLNPKARAEARALDEERRRGRVRGPLHGIPVLIKDNYDTADLPTSAGSLALAELRTPDDAFVVKRLRDAGVVILGKTNMHELAAGITNISSLGGQTRNPYDPRRCPGGSSGGTGAAIAASFAAVGWGSDTCGSIRIPAAFGSLVGLRPTQGLVSRTGIVPLSHTQDIAGPLARTVRDLAIALDVTIGADAADPDTDVLRGRAIPRFTDSLSATALRGARLGVLTHYFADTDGEIADTVRSAVSAMKALGAEVIDVRIPGFDSLMAASSVINYEMAADLADYLRARPGAPVASLTEILDRGLYHSALENRFRLVDTLRRRDTTGYARALAKQEVLRARLVTLLDSLRLDALVYPAMRQRPALVGEPQSGSTCALAAHSRLPALSMPAGFTADGLPVGIELLGRPFGDARLVAMAYAFEQAGTRRRSPPTTPALANGRAPTPVRFTVAANAGPAVARAAFTFDALRSELGYDVRVTGVAPERVQAVVLHRADSSGAKRVVHRLAGPGMATATGRIPLTGVDRRALSGEGLTMSLFVSGGPSPGTGVVHAPNAADHP